MGFKLAAAFFIVLFLLMFIPSVYGDLLWFSSINYQSVFWTVFTANVYLFLAGAIIFFLFLFINLKLVKKFSKKNISSPIVLIVIFFSLLMGIAFSSGWETALKFFNSTPFGTTDPVFGNDLSFYAFNLPFYYYILSYCFILVIFTITITTIIYIVYFRVFSVEKKENSLKAVGLKTSFRKFKSAKKHISVLLAILFFLFGIFLFLSRYEVLFSTRGTVFGAGYTDLNIQLPFLLISSIASFAAGFTLLLPRKRIPVIAVSLFLVILFIGSIAGLVVQKLIVEPDEFAVEREYIARNIDNTIEAYNLDFDEKQFPATYDLTKDDIDDNSATIDNIRLWDFRPLVRTYNQLQIFRTYYDFNDVDVDRYYFDSNYKQVMLSSRELDQNSLPDKAKTWVNEHLVYTHGYGLAMSPVDRVSEGGLPEFYVKDIPPVGMQIERPEIYYGEKTDNFVVVNTKTEEFDYPTGEENVYTTYDGDGGIELSALRRLVYAMKFSSIELLLSGSITDESRIMIYRNIEERASKIAPFLRYDNDPYIVVSNGKLYWIYDAYSITDRYPYSEPIGNFNYVRNSVKIVIDPYNGKLTYYVIDEEPIINTYRNIFPDLFKDFSEMPDDLKKHIRYPEDLFSIQASLYSTYHMRDPRVFYNKEDQWIIPEEIYRSRKQNMVPYYVIMKLPEEEKEEFILMIPFVPKGKDNMIGWMAARCDDSYGNVIVYMFSKQELIYGPMQIEARIDQDTEISQLITLWDQAGSEVIRGNLLVIPIENSLLYVETLYLQSSETAIPELKRVIVAYGDSLTMQESLKEALNTIFGESQVEEQTKEELISQAFESYNNALAYLKDGNFAKYGEEIEKLGELLEALQE